ncbi:unnamed protein product [Paramecium sonneborni]|uniref:Uncharacterized protein n=1 Tax=Paramecium sonneborni TaxID=65129 RepID=A0A8S1R562_9CILI|nr:unnamed protein product [Paramecium sonneborni]
MHQVQYSQIWSDNFQLKIAKKFYSQKCFDFHIELKDHFHKVWKCYF